MDKEWGYENDCERISSCFFQTNLKSSHNSLTMIDARGKRPTKLMYEAMQSNKPEDFNSVIKDIFSSLKSC